MAPYRESYDNDVAFAREKCIALIRQHLCYHLQENPNSSYKSWIASCHPENVRGVELDKRFLIQENNPWLEVWNSKHQYYNQTRRHASKNKLDHIINNFLGNLLTTISSGVAIKESLLEVESPETTFLDCTVSVFSWGDK